MWDGGPGVECPNRHPPWGGFEVRDGDEFLSRPELLRRSELLVRSERYQTVEIRVFVAEEASVEHLCAIDEQAVEIDGAIFIGELFAPLPRAWMPTQPSSGISKT